MADLGKTFDWLCFVVGITRLWDLLIEQRVNIIGKKRIIPHLKDSSHSHP